MDYRNPSTHKSDLKKQLESTLPEAGEFEVGAESKPPEDLSFLQSRLYSNWINLYRFLDDVLALHHDVDVQAFYLRGDREIRFKEKQLSKMAYRAVKSMNPEVPKQAKTFKAWYYSPNAFILRQLENGKNIGSHFDRRTDHLLRCNALVVDVDDGPDRKTLEEKFEETDLRPHYFIRTRPHENYFQLVFKLEDVWFGKSYREKLVKKIEYILGDLYGVFWGDMKAAKVNQMFRLPFTYRDDLKDGYVVQVIDHSDHPPYELDEVEERVEEAAEGSHDTLIRYEYGEASKGDVLGSPPIKKLRNGTVAYGSRNAALTALSYAYAMDDYTVEEAIGELTEWAINHTEGNYGDHPNGKKQEPPEVVIRSCYVNPKGIDWKVLAEVETVEGGRIGKESAKKVLKYMPKTKQVHKRKPPEELENDRFFVSLKKVLETIYELQRENGGEPVKISNPKLAENSDVSYGTLINQINPSLDQTDIKIQTKHSNQPNKFNLTQASHLIKPYAFIRHEQYGRSKNDVISGWYKYFPEKFGQFVGLLDEIDMWAASLEDEDVEMKELDIEDLDPRLKSSIRMVESHGWDEVKETLAKAGRNPGEIKEAIEKYEPDVTL